MDMKKKWWDLLGSLLRRGKLQNLTTLRDKINSYTPFLCLDLARLAAGLVIMSLKWLRIKYNIFTIILEVKVLLRMNVWRSKETLTECLNV